MANEIETTTDKKLFDRWKDNFKDFFIEDDQKKGTKNKEEKENLIEANEDPTQAEPVDKVMEKAEEKMIEHLSPALTNGKEDLEGIPEVEEEDTLEEKQEEEKSDGDIQVVENGVNGDENITDLADHEEDVTDGDSHEESFLIKETVEENANANQRSKTPFFKILANFPFMKKKAAEEQSAVELVTPVDSIDKDDKSNGLPSYHEAVNQQDENTENEDGTDKEATKVEDNPLPNGNSNAEDETDVADQVNENSSELSPSQESSEPDNGDIEADGNIGQAEEETVPDVSEETNEHLEVNQAAEEPKQEEKKFRFRFQFFTDKK
jgi:hypothetical protein